MLPHTGLFLLWKVALQMRIRRPFIIPLLLLKLFHLFFAETDFAFVFAFEQSPNGIFPKNRITVLIPLRTDLSDRQKLSLINLNFMSDKIIDAVSS
ncbi:hypothetical protein NM96_05115 [Neisseria mucosa]|nr:hypothetical protein NM96_05115 [Neisseria mucosa]